MKTFIICSAIIISSIGWFQYHSYMQWAENASHSPVTVDLKTMEPIVLIICGGEKYWVNEGQKTSDFCAYK